MARCCDYEKTLFGRFERQMTEKEKDKWNSIVMKMRDVIYDLRFDIHFKYPFQTKRIDELYLFLASLPTFNSDGFTASGQLFDDFNIMRGK